MKAAIATLATLLFAAVSYTVAKSASTFDDLQVDKFGSWTFLSDSGTTITPVAPAWSLFHSSANVTSCCAGKLIYKGTLPRKRERTDFLYLPAFGSTIRALAIDGTPVQVPEGDSSSVGPLLSLPETRIPTETLSIEISFEGPRTWLMALRKGGPTIGDLVTLTARREFDVVQQKFIPTINALGTLVGGLFFLAIYFQTRRRFPFYALFACCLLSWTIFYVFLAGHARSVDLYLGSALHLPARQLSVIGTFALVMSYRLLADAKAKASKKVVFASLIAGLISVIASLFAGYLGMPSLQVAVFSVSAFIPFVPLLSWRRHSGRRLTIGDSALFLTWFAFVGQLLDVYTVLNGLLWTGVYLPYSNRFTFPILFSASALMYLTHFAGFFERLALHTKRLKRINRSALTLVGTAYDVDALSQFADDLRKAMSVRRCSIARRVSDHEYRVTGVSGIAPEAVGQLVDTHKHDAIRRAVSAREVSISTVSTVQTPRFTTGAFVCVPVVIDEIVEYLILLSDPISSLAFSDADAPYLRQFSLMMSSHQKRLIETRSRLEAERNFKKLVETLDPSLYAFVLGNRANDNQTRAHATMRGIGHFDQVNFVGTLESIPDAREADLIDVVKKWATPTILRHGGRVRSFGGDAYLFDVVPVAGEPTQNVCSRLVKILWGLSQTQSELNSTLMAIGLNPVQFRFGGHLGECQDVNLLDLGSNVTTIIGRSVNLTQRIQSVARPGCVLVSQAVAEGVSKEFLISKAEIEFVKGMGARNHLFRIEGAREPSQSETAS